MKKSDIRDASSGYLGNAKRAELDVVWAYSYYN